MVCLNKRYLFPLFLIFCNNFVLAQEPFSFKNEVRSIGTVARCLGAIVAGFQALSYARGSAREAEGCVVSASKFALYKVGALKVKNAAKNLSAPIHAIRVMPQDNFFVGFLKSFIQSNACLADVPANAVNTRDKVVTGAQMSSLAIKGGKAVGLAAASVACGYAAYKLGRPLVSSLLPSRKDAKNF